MENDLEELELDPDEIEEPLDDLESEETINLIEEEKDLYLSSKNEVIKIIGENVFDDDLEQALLKTVTDYFENLRAHPRPGADPFDIPSLNQAIWDTFHDYENFIHEQRFENINLNELGNEVRNFVTPKVTDYLREQATAQHQKF